MGKTNEGINAPANPSLSYTLNQLNTSVVLEQYSGKKDLWEPLRSPGAPLFCLSEKGQQRYLEHLARMKNYFAYEGHFIVRSTNNFPHSAGLASSASSFAALTKCAAAAICELQKKELPDTLCLAKLSQQASGSSCRSFFSPWAIWSDETLSTLSTKWMHLDHQVIIVSASEKAVSSSEAHRRVKTSPLWPKRPERAKHNFLALIEAFEQSNWALARDICWREFHDMHALFSSSAKPFRYITPQVQDALDLLQSLWEKMEDGPIVTMDAGANIHLLYRPDQSQMALSIKQKYLVGNYDVL